MNISGIKRILYQPKIWSLFILFHLVYHQIVHTQMNTAITYIRLSLFTSIIPDSVCLSTPELTKCVAKRASLICGGHRIPTATLSSPAKRLRSSRIWFHPTGGSGTSAILSTGRILRVFLTSECTYLIW
jgi:hypothetical protein